MATIASAGNSDTACLQALEDKGYKLTAWLEDDQHSHYLATKDDLTFAAENGMALLGLVALWELYGKDWQKRGLGRGIWDRINYPEDDDEEEDTVPEH